jgi:CSLREA domain-containing protein
MNRRIASLCTLVSAIALVGAPLAAPARAATTFTVNSADDVDDGACDATHCSLREAISAANANPGVDTIAFQISGAPIIKPTTPLPTISDPVVLDGTTQGGFVGSPIVEIDGSNAGSGASGLHITAGGSTVRGLVINSFAANGILISSAGGNTVVGSFIGTDVAGTTARANGGGQPASDPSGVGGVRIVGVSGNRIGGTVPADRNVISGNARNGVTLTAGASANVIAGNYIGLDVTGATPLGQEAGITIVDSPSNTVGGTTPGSRNVISDNSREILIEGLASTGNLVAGNYLGTDATGSFAPASNCCIDGSGIVILGAPGNMIGGTSAAARNVISGHHFHGVGIDGTGSTGNLVQGNFIGTDATGTKSIPNRDDSLGLGGGIVIGDASNNTIGGTASGAGNVISGNGSNGIAILDSGGLAAANLIQGNFIGTDVTGTKALGNFPFDAGTGQGILLWGTGNTVGGTTAAARNVIAANTGPGIEIRADANVVQGNYIGTDVTGTVALGNGANPFRGDLGGVLVVGHNNQLGGTTEAARNVISGNRGGGVVLTFSFFTTTTSGNLVQGNFIGPDATGTATLGNQGEGILDFSSVGNNNIGGTTAGSGNFIRGNSASGVLIVGFGVTGDAILGNSITGNGEIGIDLSSAFPGDGVTANDPGDADTGPNQLQNFPVLGSATSGAAGTVVTGTFNSHAVTTYRVELFANAACDPSGHGEGETFLGATSVTTDTNGNGSFGAQLTLPVAAGQVATATATDPSGNTSEFSACAPVRSASQAIGGIIGGVGNTGLSQGNQNSLTSKLQAAQSSLAGADTTAACNQLDAFSNEVEAKLKTGALTTQEAKALLDAVKEVKTVIGCP